MKDLLLQNLKKYKILVIGDSILDKYYYGEVNRISPEAPVPINHVITVKNKLGGAANVANNLYNLGCQVSIITHIGNDENGNILLNLFNDMNIISIRSDQTTTTKIRIIGDNQQMLRLDFEEKLRLQNLKYVMDIINNQIKDNDVVIISDYGKGFCNEAICQNIIMNSNILNKTVIIDPKGKDWNKYKNANYITPNMNEMSDVLSFKISNNDKIIEQYGSILIDKFNLEGLLITRSERGLSIINHKDKIHILANNKREVRDVTGCGDTAIAMFAFAKALNIDNYDAAYLANLAASITVTKVGTYSPSLDEIVKLL